MERTIPRSFNLPLQNKNSTESIIRQDGVSQKLKNSTLVQKYSPGLFGFIQFSGEFRGAFVWHYSRVGTSKPWSWNPIHRNLKTFTTVSNLMQEIFLVSLNILFSALGIVINITIFPDLTDLRRCLPCQLHPT